LHAAERCDTLGLMNIFEQWGVRPIINAAGSVTRLGGAPLPAAVLEAFGAAAGECVPLDELQGAASRLLAEITGAEAGLVTAGAAAGLLLGTAAILTGFDLARMERLPDTADFPHEFIVAREQRNGYDHAVRAAGARLVEVGFHEIVAGAGVRRAEAWEFEAACGPRTAGVLYVYDAAARPPLAEVVAVAHRRGVPVLVDAAGELPPRRHLRDLVASGADLVVFSGGKGLRGPQATGILCGKRELIGAAALQMLDMDDHFELWEPPANLIDKKRLPGLPRHGIGRALKVSKEQIAALLTALRLFASGAYDEELPEKRRLLERIATALSVPCQLIVPADGQGLPLLEIAVGEAAFAVCLRLRRGRPGVHVGQALLGAGKLIINPLHLNDERTETLIQRLCEELKASPILGTV
jgi:D-glucosaminate-6-phosphate ammonia-lyase